MPSSNYCFLTCMQVSQETGKVIWNSHYFKNFPQFVVIHTVKGLPQSMKQKWMFFWNSLAFPMIQRMLALCSLVPLSFFSLLQFSLVFSITIPTFPFFSLLCISIKGRGNRDQIANICWILEKARESQKNIYLCFIDYAKAFDCVDHNKLWKILKEMGIPDHLTCLLRNLYAGQEATVLTGHGTTD